MKFFHDKWVWGAVGLLALAGSSRADYEVITANPADRLVNRSLWSFDTAGNQEGWTAANAASVTAAGGSLVVTGNAGATDGPSARLLALANGPDLDLGFFDYIQIRLKRPAASAADVKIQFGTSTAGGFAAARLLTIPNSLIPADGAFHAYRLDVGLTVYWRDRLTDLQVKPLGDAATGAAFEIDYVEVGDIPNDTHYINSNLNYASGESLATVSRLESKHCASWWSPTTYTVSPSFNPAVHPRRALRMMEECYQVYCKKLGYGHPFENTNPAARDGKRYKSNHITWYDGFWMSAWT